MGMQSWEVAMASSEDAARYRGERDRLILALRNVLRAIDVNDNPRDMGVSVDDPTVLEAKALLDKFK